MSKPLRDRIYAAALVIILILATVLAMGYRQHQLRLQERQIMGQSGELLYRYALLRERLIEALLAGGNPELMRVADELERFHSDITALSGNRLVPAEYRVNVTGQLDLSGLILKIRKLDRTPDREQAAAINSESRQLLERLLALDRMIEDDAQARLTGFQEVAIGALALVICIVVVLMVIGQQTVVEPLLRLIRQVHEIGAGERHRIALPPSWAAREVIGLADTFQGLIDQLEVKQDCRRLPVSLRTTRMAAIGECLSGIAHEISNLSNGIINYAQLLADRRTTDAEESDSDAIRGIRDEGERIAEIAKKLLYYGGEEEQARDFVAIETIVGDALTLIGHHLKIEGISYRLECRQIMPRLPVRIGDINLVLLLLLDLARQSLNARYPANQGGKKSIEIAIQVGTGADEGFVLVDIIDGGQPLAEEIVTCAMGDLTTVEKTTDPTARNLMICRELVEKGHRGRFAVDPDPEGNNRVRFSLPVHS